MRPDSCLDCAFHRVLPDPDPDDWFCHDDVKVSCTRQPGRYATQACRPYEVKRETTPPPSWCPLALEDK